MTGSHQITIETLQSEVIDEVHQRINVKKPEFRNDSDSDRSKTSENEDNYFQTLFEENNEQRKQQQNNNKVYSNLTSSKASTSSIPSIRLNDKSMELDEPIVATNITGQTEYYPKVNNDQD